MPIEDLPVNMPTPNMQSVANAKRANTPEQNKVNAATTESFVTKSQSSGASSVKNRVWPTKNKLKLANKIVRSTSTPQLQTDAQTKRNALYHLLNIRFPPDEASKEEFIEKQRFVDAHISAESAAVVCEQTTKHPVMQEAISQLNHSLEQIGDGSHDLAQKKKLSYQLKNVNYLAKAIANFPMENKGLASKENMAFLEPFLKGEEEFKEHDLRTLKKMLQNLEERTETPAKEKMSKTLIAAQADLFKAEREALGIASKMDTLPNEDLSENLVVFLRNAEGEKVAVYKETKGGEQGSGIMEELLWEVSGLTGNHELLVATKRSRARTKKDFEPMLPRNKNAPELEKSMTWTKPEGEMYNLLEPARRGGLQPFQKGTLLKQWQEQTGEKPAIDRESLRELTHFAIKIGVSDMHDENIMCMPDGKLKLFDNTRSLPNSNGVYFYEADLRIPCKMGIFNLKELHEPLTPQDREFLQEQIAKDQKDVDKLEKFFQDLSKDKKKLSKLPPGWFDTEKIIIAMRERVAGMQAALDHPNVNTLADFAIFSIPNFKFVLACSYLQSNEKELQLLHEGDPSPLQAQKSERLMKIGYGSSVTDLIDLLTRKGLDPLVVLDIANNDQDSLDQMLEKLASYLASNQNPQPNQYQQNADKLKMEFLRQAQIDAKDKNAKMAGMNKAAYHELYEELEETVVKEFKKEVANSGLPLVPETATTFNDFEATSPTTIWVGHDTAKNRFTLYYHDKSGKAIAAQMDPFSTTLKVEGLALPKNATIATVKELTNPVNR